MQKFASAFQLDPNTGSRVTTTHVAGATPKALDTLAQVTPWGKKKGVRIQPWKGFIGLSCFVCATISPLQGDGVDCRIPPGCYPGLKLSNAFGVIIRPDDVVRTHAARGIMW